MPKQQVAGQQKQCQRVVDEGWADIWLSAAPHFILFGGALPFYGPRPHILRLRLDCMGLTCWVTEAILEGHPAKQFGTSFRTFHFNLSACCSCRWLIELLTKTELEPTPLSLCEAHACYISKLSFSSFIAVPICLRLTQYWSLKDEREGYYACRWKLWAFKAIFRKIGIRSGYYN